MLAGAMNAVPTLPAARPALQEHAPVTGAPRANRTSYRSIMPETEGDVTRVESEMTRIFLVEVALRAYEDAGFAGLCADGRWEAAVSAMRSTALPDIPSRPESDKAANA